MSAPDVTPPSTNPLRQAFRALVPRPVRAALHAAIVAPARWPGFIVRQVRRAGWAIRDAMSPPNQLGLFFWHVGRAPGRLVNAVRQGWWSVSHFARHGWWDLSHSARHAGWEMRRSARHARWEMQRTARHAGLGMQRSARVMTNHAQALSRRRWRLPSFGRRSEAPAPQLPSFADALARMERHQLGSRSINNIGAGSGGDTEFVQRSWPEARTLLIEMDAAYEGAFRELQRTLPNLAWDICAAGPEDRLGRMQKTDIGGVGGALDLEGGASAGGADVQVKRIDTLVREHALEPPYFLRFDTHGFELDILAGATETLRQTALIQMETYNFKLGFTGGKNLTFDEMSLHMKSLGFRCVDMCDPLYRPGDHALWQMHLFFIRADHPLWANTGFTAPGAQSDI
jgi:FkbM family methyltransferase